MELFPRDKIPENPKILVIKLPSIGDGIYNIAVYTPPLKNSFPGSHLSVLVEPASYDIVRHHLDVDEVLCFEKNISSTRKIFISNFFPAGTTW